MVEIISFEGCVGAGKTSLTNYFSYEFGVERLLEEHEKNPFLKEFYEGFDVTFETEITFLLIHNSQLRKAVDYTRNNYMFSDFSIEKDLVYARMNLDSELLKTFENVYNYVIEQNSVPEVVFYLDISPKVLRRRIFQRGRLYEIKTNPSYFKEYYEKVKEYFRNESQSEVFFFNVDDLALDPDNEKLSEIRNKILDIMND